MMFEEWWRKEAETVEQYLDDEYYAYACSTDLAAIVGHFAEIAWLEGYAQGQMDSTGA